MSAPITPRAPAQAQERHMQEHPATRGDQRQHDVTVYAITPAAQQMHGRHGTRLIWWGAMLLLLVGWPSVASAQTASPWIVYGQTAPICQGGITNPVPSSNGLIGEVAALPYTVPDGKVLVVEAYGLEAYGNVPGGLVLVPYIGATPPTLQQFLHSVFSDNASNETVGVEFRLPAGKVFNLLLMSNECPAQVVGWYVKGKLVDQ